MLTIFSPIQNRLKKLIKYHEITYDGWLFRLHCVLTVTVLMGASVVLTSVQLMGKPIYCITSDQVQQDRYKAIETFCWANSTYLMPPGMAQQGIVCYLPKVLWKRFESDLLGKLATGLQDVLCRKDEVEKRCDAIICYLRRYRNQHKFYPLVYWCCEGLCLLNLVLQMVFMNRFLGGNFFSLGTEALKNSNLSQYERTDPLIYIFPRITKCDFYSYGPSGTIKNTDALCVLPQNVMNEKVYIFLWFWYTILTFLFACLMVYRVILLLLPNIRPWLLVFRSNQLVSCKRAKEVSSDLDLGDWWLVYMLAKNMDPLAYRDMLAEYVKPEKKGRLLN